ncbi:transketolase C-terminal domain-containing protein, partial [Pseudomonadota bacterium]
EGGVPEGYYETDEGEPVVRRQGKDLTLVTVGPVLYSGLQVVEQMKDQYGLEVELIDLRFINPLNYDVLIESVRKTGRVVLASDAVERGSALHNIASNLTTLCFDDASRGDRLPQLDFAGCRTGEGLLPAGTVDYRRHSRARVAPAWSCSCPELHQWRVATNHPAGCVD